MAKNRNSQSEESDLVEAGSIGGIVPMADIAPPQSPRKPLTELPDKTQLVTDDRMFVASKRQPIVEAFIVA